MAEQSTLFDEMRSNSQNAVATILLIIAASILSLLVLNGVTYTLKGSNIFVSPDLLPFIPFLIVRLVSGVFFASRLSGQAEIDQASFMVSQAYGIYIVSFAYAAQALLARLTDGIGMANNSFFLFLATAQNFLSGETNYTAIPPLSYIWDGGYAAITIAAIFLCFLHGRHLSVIKDDAPSIRSRTITFELDFARVHLGIASLIAFPAFFTTADFFVVEEALLDTLEFWGLLVFSWMLVAVASITTFKILSAQQLNLWLVIQLLLQSFLEALVFAVALLRFLYNGTILLVRFIRENIVAILIVLAAITATISIGYLIFDRFDLSPVLFDPYTLIMIFLLPFAFVAIYVGFGVIVFQLLPWLGDQLNKLRDWGDIYWRPIQRFLRLWGSSAEN